MDLKRALEAILFASARRLTTRKLAVLTRKNDDDVARALSELQEEIDQDHRPIKLIHEGDTWRITVKEQYLPVVRKIVTKTELPKSILETLAIVAYKAPVLQSDVIKIRTNKAYDHLCQLEEAGFLTREKHGRTKIVKLTQKFYDYFDIDATKLKGKFENVKRIEQAITRKEEEVMSKGLGPTYESEHLEEYSSEDAWTGSEPYQETVGELAVYNTEPTAEDALKEELEEEAGHIPTKQELKELAKSLAKRHATPTSNHEPPIDRFKTKDFEKRVDKRVKEIMGESSEKPESQSEPEDRTPTQTEQENPQTKDL